MNLYGQVPILRELNAIIVEIRKGINFNVLFSGPSGYGKTTLAYHVISQVKDVGGYQISGPPEFFCNENYRTHLFDEIHEHKNPENLYPLMDANRFIWLFATNEAGKLKEPLRNRCIILQLVPYTESEINNIIRDNLSVELSDEMITNLVTKSKLNPRIAKILSTRVSTVFRYYGVPKSIDELEETVFSTLGIDTEGLDINDRSYIQFIQQAGGCASLHSIVSGIGLDVDTVRNLIEPNLLRIGRIRITSKGRNIA